MNGKKRRQQKLFITERQSQTKSGINAASGKEPKKRGTEKIKNGEHFWKDSRQKRNQGDYLPRPEGEKNDAQGIKLDRVKSRRLQKKEGNHAWGLTFARQTRKKKRKEKRETNPK